MNIHTCYSYGITLYGAMNKITIKISLNVKLTSNNVKKNAEQQQSLEFYSWIKILHKFIAFLTINRNRSIVNLYRILTLQNWFLRVEKFSIFPVVSNEERSTKEREDTWTMEREKPGNEFPSILRWRSAARFETEAGNRAMEGVTTWYTSVKRRRVSAKLNIDVAA